jgi:eukaryotic-like serine/threonine-protein kinase
MNAVSIRGDWVGQVIDGKYPLIEWLGGSGTSGNFLTELDGLGSRKAAIKLLLSSPQAEDRFAGWKAAASLSHPHLARIIHYGRSEVDAGPVLYIVSELAEELLSQIIPERALSTEEARQMLSPVLDALGYLREVGYVHGHLKPSNILVVENDIKLSSDALIPIGKHAPELLTNDIHIAPEVATDPVAPPADVWSLGITLVEALTQQPPIWDAATDSEPVLAASIPEPFSQVARQCLQPDPSRRCSLSQIRALLEGKPKSTFPKHPQTPPQAPHHDERLAAKPLPSRMPFLPLIIGLVLLAAIIIGFSIHTRKTIIAPLQTESTRQAPPAEPDSKAEQQQANPTPPPSPRPEAAPPVSSLTESPTEDVVTRDVPEVPQRARNTIHGTVGVVVRVNIDSSGAVTNAEYATHGPSAYFARIALDSARKWKFKTPQQTDRTWLLHYRFRREGVEVTPKLAGAQ